MSSYIFYPTKKVIKTKYTAFIKYKFLIPLRNFHVWIFYSDGHWVFYDCSKNELIHEGKIEGDTSKLIDVVKSPRAIDEDHIIFANCTNFKLECLNPYTGKLDNTWTGDAPTLEALPQSDRSNDTKINDAYNDLEIEILNRSKLVGMIERRETNQGNADYLLTVYQQNSKERIAQVIHNAQQKQMNLCKGNEEDTFILWTPYQSGNFQFSYFNVNTKDQGLKNINVQQNINTTVLGCFPWDNNVITFFGNADASGTPEQYTYDFNKADLKVLQMAYYPEGKDTLMTDVVSADAEKKRVLLTECVDTLNVVLYNAKTNKADFLKEQTENGVYATSYDGRYFVEYDGVLSGEEDPNKAGETQISVNSLVNKKMFMLHFMKNARSKNGRTFLEFYGNPYIAKHVAEMLSA